MEATRRHTIALLESISRVGENETPLSLVAFRAILRNNANHDGDSFEACSNLFYFLFDNWDSAYRMILRNKEQLEVLVS